MPSAASLRNSDSNALFPLSAEMENRRSLTVRPGRSETGNGGERPSRKRQSDIGGEPSTSRQRTRDPSPEAGNRSDDEYDPDQPMQDRRAIQRQLRDMQREMRENPDHFMQDDPTALLDFFKKSDRLIKEVKQTAEAAIDSRGLVIAAELSSRRVQRLTAGNVGNGIDVDEFVSKCITFMRNGGGIEDDDAAELSSTQRRRRRAAPSRGAIGSDDEEDAAGDDGDMMNWAHLGRFASVPAVRRPCLPGFLLGPLSIEKKVRRITKRAAPFRINSLREVRPEELRAEDLKKSDKNDLPSICKKIYVKLQSVQVEAQNATEAELEAVDEDREDYKQIEQEIMSKYALRETGGIDLMRFVINPRSFGQTVENMFYVSFLIREGSVKLAFDEHGLPAIEPVLKNPSAETSSRAKTAMRHQAIMSLDMTTWRDIIEAFDIRESIIPHRQEDDGQGPGARGWYN